MHDLLADDDLPGARQRLTHLVGRDTSVLDEAEVSRAVVESVAENTSDAVVAPLVWGALLGVPGLVGYRAANTLDAMVGHRGERYGRFGWASARFDDLLNLPGARLSGVLAAALAPTVGGRPSAALHAWRRDARRHPSPNAGVVEAAFAGALGVRLGGRNHYAHGTEDRMVLGDGRPRTARTSSAPYASPTRSAPAPSSWRRSPPRADPGDDSMQAVRARTGRLERGRCRQIAELPAWCAAGAGRRRWTGQANGSGSAPGSPASSSRARAASLCSTSTSYFVATTWVIEEKSRCPRVKA